MFVFLSLFALHAYAQDNVKVNGKVANSTNNTPIEFASVIVESGTDGYIGEAITDKDGNFVIEVPKGNLVFVFEALGFISSEKQVDIQDNTSLGNILLQTEQVISLEGATIVAEKPIYKVELDKKVYDMASDPMSQGQNLSDALANVPSVQVDAEGNVSLRGNDNVKFLVDGKPSGMLGISDPAEALKNIPAENVERIEVITNPSSRYEASGSAGIINIVLKKGANTGFNGSVTVNGGIPETVGANVNLNYRTKKFNWFTNFGTRYSEREGEGRAFLTNYDEDTHQISDYRSTNRDNDRIRRNYNVRFGTEYYIDNNNTIGASAGYRYNNGNNLSHISYNNFDNLMNWTSLEERIQNEKEIENNFDVDLSYKHEFDKKGHEFSFTARYSYQKEDEDGLIQTNRNDARNEQTLSLEEQTTVVLTADYIRPIGEKGKFELGARTDLNNNVTDSKNYFINSDNTLTPNERFYSNLENQQNVFASYVQYGNSIGNFQYFLGVRVEHSEMNIDDHLNSANNIKKKYTDWFPSATFNYSFNEKNELQLSYSRRIRRPMSFMLMPFFNSTDDRNIRYGNPDLDPTYTNSIELSYITTIGKLMVTPSLFYQRTTDMMSQFQRKNYTYTGLPTATPTADDFADTFITRPINIGEEDRYGLDLTATYRPFRWWNLMLNVNLFGYKRTGFYSETNNDYVNPNTYNPAQNNLETKTDSQDFSGDGFSSRGRLSSNFTLPKDFKVQLAANYMGSIKTEQEKMEDNLSMDFSLSKDLLKGNASIAFNIRDVFNSRKRESTNYLRYDDGSLQSTNYNSMRWNVRTFNLSFTYRIKSQQRQKGERPNGEEGGMMEGEMVPE